MSPKLICYKNWMSTRLKYHQNWNVTKTEMVPKLNISSNPNLDPGDRPWWPWPCYNFLIRILNPPFFLKADIVLFLVLAISSRLSEVSRGKEVSRPFTVSSLSGLLQIRLWSFHKVYNCAEVNKGILIIPLFTKVKFTESLRVASD